MSRMQTAQIIALFMPETTVEVFTGPNSFFKGATALLRDVEDQMRSDSVSSEAAMEQSMTTSCFK